MNFPVVAAERNFSRAEIFEGGSASGGPRHAGKDELEILKPSGIENKG
jgi:hypothetical protein